MRELLYHHQITRDVKTVEIKQRKIVCILDAELVVKLKGINVKLMLRALGSPSLLGVQGIIIRFQLFNNQTLKDIEKITRYYKQMLNSLLD
ncbi:hypothetical protein KY285_005295 [Solanum tuberosum]|nr:hypothetical protein KY284_005514 [Solanum tuberosum]KAH0752147.1 hypothetical protein KY285_005295 [Solanum tuberosum]